MTTTNGRNSDRWLTASTREPCPVCKKPDWCRVSPDGKWCACRRESQGAKETKQYSDGTEAHIHLLRDDPPNGKPHPTAKPPGDASSNGSPTPTADADTRDRAYRMLLAVLQLSEPHRDNLRARGLTEEHIEAGGYRTLPEDSRDVARRLWQALGDNVARTVPGIGPTHIYAPAGLLVPVRDLQGKTLALKVRRDSLDGGPRFLYLSSSKHNGPSPGSPAHVPVGIVGPCPVARITEGELKADATWRLSGVPTISFPGVASWRTVLGVLTELRARKVRVAFDADARSNANVARPLRECVMELAARGYGVELEVWPIAAGKGIDDLLNAGGTPELLAGPDALQAVRGIANTAGVPDDGEPEQQKGEPTEPKNKAETPPAWVPFPVDILPEPVRSFVRDGSTAMGCDASYIALPLLVACGAAIGNTRRLTLKRGWVVPPVLWAAIVGESGTTKSPALKLVMKPFRDRQRKALDRHAQDEQQYEIELAHWDRQNARWKREKGDDDPPEKPKCPQAVRNIVSDTTLEGLAPLLLANPRGLLAVRDELAGWLGSFDQYKNGKGGDSASWLSMYDAESVIIDRKTGSPRTLFVPNAAVSVVGGIQPGILRRALGAVHRESGLAARLLVTCPPRLAKRWRDDDIDPAAEQELARIVDCLYELQPTTDADGNQNPVVVGLSLDAHRLWRDYYNAHGQEQVDLHGDLASAFSKLEAIPARLALVLHCITQAAEGDRKLHEDQVSVDTIGTAIRMAEWLKHETKRVYAILGENDEQADTRELLEWVNRKGGRVTIRDLQQGPRRYRGSQEAAERALEEMVTAGYGRWEEMPTTAQGGRPTRVFQSGDGGSGYTTPSNQGGSGYTTPSNQQEKVGSVAVASVATLKSEKSTLPQDNDAEWGEV